MATKTTPAKKKHTTAKSTTANSAASKPNDPEVAILRSAACPTLSLSGTIGYEIISRIGKGIRYIRKYR